MILDHGQNKYLYSNHLNTGLVWYSNGRFMSGCQMVWYLNGGLKNGLKEACIKYFTSYIYKLSCNGVAMILNGFNEVLY